MSIEALDIEIKHQSKNADDAVERLLRSIGKLPGTLNSVGAAAKAPIKAVESLKRIVDQMASMDKGIQSARKQADAYRETAEAARSSAEAARKRAAAARESADAAREEAAALRAQREQSAARKAYNAIKDSTAYERLQNQIPATFKALTSAFMNDADQGAIDRLIEKSHRLYMQMQFMQKPMEGPIDIDAIVRSSTELDRLQHKLAEVRMALQYSLEQGDTQTNIDALIEKYQSLSSEIEKLAPKVKTLKSYLSGFKAVVPGIAEIVKLLGSMAAKIGKVALGAAKKAVVSIGKSITAPIRKLSKFMSMIGRMALYRAIRSAIKMISQGISEGTKNLAQWDYYTGRISASKAYDTLQQYGSALAMIKNSVGAAAMPILQLLLPAFNAIANAAIRAFNAVNMLFSALLGSSKYTHATAATGYELADSFASAGGAASDLKNTILGFDELNVMNDVSGGGGGGGAGAWSSDLEDMFSDADIPESVKTFLDRVKEAWKNADFTELGSEIAGKFNDLVNNINFESIKSGGSRFISSFTSLINGFIADADWRAVGQKVSDGIATAIGFLGQLLSDVNWDDVASAISDFLSGMDTGDIVDAISGVIKSGFEAIITLLSANGGELSSTIRDFVTDLWNALVSAFSSADIASLHNQFSYWLDRTIFGEDFANTVWAKGEYAGKEVIEGWIYGTNGKTAELQAAYGDITGAIDTALAKSAESGVDAGKTWWEKFKEGLSRGAESADQDMFGGQGQHGGSGTSGEFPMVGGSGTSGKFSMVSFMHEMGIKSAPSFAAGFNGQISKENLHADVHLEPSIKVNQNTIDSKFGSSGSSKLELPMEAKLINWHRDRSVWTADWDMISFTANLNNWQKDPNKWKGDNWNNINFKANLNNWQKDPNKWKGASWNNINFKANLNDWQKDPDKWKGASWNNIDFNANIVKVIPPTKTEQISVNAKIDKVITPDGKFTLTKAAKGGAFYGGGWHSIPQYADGGSVHGSLFLAGEAGPEIVGHVGGRTEVLNSSQLAATMVAAVASAMSGNNALIREQNGLLREMASRESTVRAVVSTTDIASGASRMNRRAGTTIIPVGA